MLEIVAKMQNASIQDNGFGWYLYIYTFPQELHECGIDVAVPIVSHEMLFEDLLRLECLYLFISSGSVKNVLSKKPFC